MIVSVASDTSMPVFNEVFRFFRRATPISYSLQSFSGPTLSKKILPWDSNHTFGLLEHFIEYQPSNIETMASASSIDPTILTRILVCIALLLLVVTWIATFVFARQYRPTGWYNEDGRWEWNADGPEAEQDNQVLFASQFLMISLVGMVFVIGYTSFRAMFGKQTTSGPSLHANLGNLSGALMVYGFMSLLGFFYFRDFGIEEQGDQQENQEGEKRLLQENNQYNYYNGYQLPEGYVGMLFTRYQMVFFIVYSLVSAAILALAFRLIPLASTKNNENSSMGSSDNINPSSSSTSIDVDLSMARVEMLRDIFQIVSVLAIICAACAWIVGLVAPIVIFANDEGERNRMREEGREYNFIGTTSVVLLLVVIITIVGLRSLRTSALSKGGVVHPLETGALQGFLYMFPVLALFMAALYNGLSYGMFRDNDFRRRRDDVPIGSSFFNSACLTVALLYIIVAYLMNKYSALLERVHRELNSGIGASDDVYDEMTDQEDPTSIELQKKRSQVPHI